MTTIPEGFVQAGRSRPNPFNEIVGPFYERREGARVSLGLRIVRASAIFALSAAPK